MSPHLRLAGGRPTIVVLGDVALDVVVRLTEPSARDSDASAHTVLSGGGAGANVAAWLASAGAPCLLVGRVGDDAAGREQASALRAGGVGLHLAVDTCMATGTIVVVVTPDGDRTMYPDRGANLALVPADLPDPIGKRGDHLHVSGYALLHPGPRPTAMAALRAARAAGMTTSVDASSAAPLRQLGAAAFAALIADVDILRANLDEALVLSPEAADAAEAVAHLAPRHPLVVVTAGADGAWVGQGASLAHVPAPSVVPVDPVGAGDALTAGFLAHWVDRRNEEPAAALVAGTALAERALRRAGPQPGA